eukprot:scaffold1345_cov173-Ochromonas_danica.AAC.2
MNEVFPLLLRLSQDCPSLDILGDLLMRAFSSFPHSKVAPPYCGGLVVEEKTVLIYVESYSFYQALLLAGKIELGNNLACRCIPLPPSYSSCLLRLKIEGDQATEIMEPLNVIVNIVTQQLKEYILELHYGTDQVVIVFRHNQALRHGQLCVEEIIKGYNWRVAIFCNHLSLHDFSLLSSLAAVNNRMEGEPFGDEVRWSASQLTRALMNGRKEAGSPPLIIAVFPHSLPINRFPSEIAEEEEVKRNSRKRVWMVVCNDVEAMKLRAYDPINYSNGSIVIYDMSMVSIVNPASTKMGDENALSPPGLKGISASHPVVGRGDDQESSQFGDGPSPQNYNAFSSSTFMDSSSFLTSTLGEGKSNGMQEDFAGGVSLRQTNFSTSARNSSPGNSVIGSGRDPQNLNCDDWLQPSGSSMTNSLFPDTFPSYDPQTGASSRRSDPDSFQGNENSLLNPLSGSIVNSLSNMSKSSRSLQTQPFLTSIPPMSSASVIMNNDAASTAISTLSAGSRSSFYSGLQEVPGKIYRGSYVFADREAGIFFFAFENHFKDYLKKTFQVVVEESDFSAQYNTKGSGMYGGIEGIDGFERESISQGADYPPKNIVLKVTFFGPNPKNVLNTRKYLEQLNTTSLARIQLFFPKVGAKKYKEIYQCKTNQLTYLHQIRSQILSYADGGASLPQANIADASKAVDPLISQGFVNIRMKPPFHPPSHQHSSFPLDVTVTICGSIFCTAHLPLLQSIEQAFHSLSSDYLILDLKIPAHHPMKRHLTIKALREELIMRHGLVALRWEEASKASNNLGTAKVWAESVTAIQSLMKEIQAAENMLSLPGGGESSNYTDMNKDLEYHLLVNRTTNTIHSTLPAPSQSTNILDGLGGKNQNGQMTGTLNGNALTLSAANNKGVLMDRSGNAPLLDGANKNNNSSLDDNALNNNREVVKAVVHLPDLTLRYVLLAPSVSAAFHDLLTSYSTTSDDNSKLNMKYPYRDRHDPYAMLLLEGDAEVVDKVRWAVTKWLSETAQALHTIYILVPEDLYLQLLLRDDLTAVKHIQGQAGVYLKLLDHLQSRQQSGNQKGHSNNARFNQNNSLNEEEEALSQATSVFDMRLLRCPPIKEGGDYGLGGLEGNRVDADSNANDILLSVNVRSLPTTINGVGALGAFGAPLSQSNRSLEVSVASSLDSFLKSSTSSSAHFLTFVTPKQPITSSHMSIVFKDNDNVQGESCEESAGIIVAFHDVLKKYILMVQVPDFLSVNEGGSVSFDQLSAVNYLSVARRRLQDCIVWAAQRGLSSLAFLLPTDLFGSDNSDGQYSSYWKEFSNVHVDLLMEIMSTPMEAASAPAVVTALGNSLTSIVFVECKYSELRSAVGAPENVPVANEDEQEGEEVKESTGESEENIPNNATSSSEDNKPSSSSSTQSQINLIPNKNPPVVNRILQHIDHQYKFPSFSNQLSMNIDEYQHAGHKQPSLVIQMLQCNAPLPVMFARHLANTSKVNAHSANNFGSMKMPSSHHQQQYSPYSSAWLLDDSANGIRSQSGHYSPVNAFGADNSGGRARGLVMKGLKEGLNHALGLMQHLLHHPHPLLYLANHQQQAQQQQQAANSINTIPAIKPSPSNGAMMFGGAGMDPKVIGNFPSAAMMRDDGFNLNQQYGRDFNARTLGVTAPSVGMQMGDSRRGMDGRNNNNNVFLNRPQAPSNNYSQFYQPQHSSHQPQRSGRQLAQAQHAGRGGFNNYYEQQSNLSDGMSYRSSAWSDSSFSRPLSVASENIHGGRPGGEGLRQVYHSDHRQGSQQQHHHYYQQQQQQHQPRSSFQLYSSYE